MGHAVQLRALVRTHLRAQPLRITPSVARRPPPGGYDRSVQHHRRHHTREPQAGDEGCGLPVAVRHTHPQALTSWGPAVGTRHLGRGPGLVDKHQAFGIEIKLRLEPSFAPLHNVGTVLFAGVRGLFLRVTP